MDRTIEITLDIDGWRPTVAAERLMPESLLLAIHPDPWHLCQRQDGEPLPRETHWCVSDVVSGRLVAMEPRRAMAIVSAFKRLGQEAEARTMDIPTLLAVLRKPDLH